MVDRERVIQALERCIDGCSSECPYEYGGAVTLEYCRADLMRDALELLKEQEPIKPYIDSFNDSCWWATGCCGTPINFKKDKFCPKCGRKVKWE